MPNSKAPAGHFTLLYFASASSYAQKDADTFAAPMTCTQLFKALDDKYPGMQSKILDSCALTVNLDYVDLEDPAAIVTIHAGDEVAIIPPVSSG